MKFYKIKVFAGKYLMNKYKLRHKILNILNGQHFNASIEHIDHPYINAKIPSYEKFCLTKEQLSEKLKVDVSNVREQLSYLSSKDEIKTEDEFGVKITLMGRQKFSDRFYLEENKHYNFESFKRLCNYVILPITIISILLGILFKVLTFDPNSIYINKMKNNIITKDSTNQNKLKIETSIIDTSLKKENPLDLHIEKTKKDIVLKDSINNIFNMDSLNSI